MSNNARLAIAAVAVAIVAIVGISLLPGSGAGEGIASPSPTAETSTAAPTASASQPEPSASASIPAVGGGTYSLGPASRYVVDRNAIPAELPHGITFSVPPGWSDLGGIGVSRNDVSLTFQMLESIYINPCRWSAGEFADPPFMRTITLTAEALWVWWNGDPANVEGFGDAFPTLPRASEPAKATVDGRSGRYYVEIRMPEDLDLSDCDGGEYRIWIDRAGGIKTVRRAGELDRIWITFLQGSGIVVIDAASMPASSPDDLAELDAILDSIHID